MISLKSFYKASDVASAEYIFPKEEEAVRSFFIGNNLLSSFKEEQIQHVTQSLAGKSVDLLSVMSVLERSVLLGVKGEPKQKVSLQKDDVLKARNSINKKAIAVLGIAGRNSEEKMPISIADLL